MYISPIGQNTQYRRKETSFGDFLRIPVKTIESLDAIKKQEILEALNDSKTIQNTEKHAQEIGHYIQIINELAKEKITTILNKLVGKENYTIIPGDMKESSKLFWLNHSGIITQTRH